MKKAAGLFVVLFAFSQVLLAQSKGEMPFSGSPEQNQKLREAWSLMTDARAADAREKLKQLREADQQFAMAYLFTEADLVKERESATKALGLRASAGEKAFIQARLANLDKKPVGSYLEPLVKKYQKDKQVLSTIAFMMGLKEEAPRSIEIFSLVIKKYPDYASAYNLRGYRYMSMNEMEKAGSDFEKYVSLRPDLANVYDSRADYLMRIGKTEEAIPLYEKAAEMDPKAMANSRVKAENAKNRAFGYKIPERTLAQKHNRSIFFANISIIVAISDAKKSGMSAVEYGNHVGNMFKTSWNRAAGFEGWVRGTLFNYESIRGDSDPPMEILSQTLDRIQFKWKINYKNMFQNDTYGVTFEEFQASFTEIHSVIGDYLGGTYNAVVQADDWLLITLTRKPAAPGAP